MAAVETVEAIEKFEAVEKVEAVENIEAVEHVKVVEIAKVVERVEAVEKLDPVEPIPIASSPRNMQGMNPERVRMLLQSSPSPDEDQDPHGGMGVGSGNVPPIGITGANLLALGNAAARVKEEEGSLPRLLPQATEPRPMPLVMKGQPSSGKRRSTVAGTKRAHSELDEKGKKHKTRPDPRTEFSDLPVLPPAPPSNPHTVHLESLLECHPLLLTLQPKGAKISNSATTTLHRIISNAGLLLNEVIQAQFQLPMLRLPTQSRLSGGLDRTVEGELLENVWFELTPQAKFGYARQLRKILTKMRSAAHNGKKRQLGSIRSGPYSLILDKHLRNTYWTIRPNPTDLHFVAFLLSSFSSSVPNAVAATLARQFRPSYSLVLSHGELGPRNIIVNGSKIVCITGWDCAGWYPEWWEYAKFFEARTRPENQDWYEYAGDIFSDEYPNELAAYQGISRCQKP